MSSSDFKVWADFPAVGEGALVASLKSILYFLPFQIFPEAGCSCSCFTTELWNCGLVENIYRYNITVAVHSNYNHKQVILTRHWSLDESNSKLYTLFDSKCFIYSQIPTTECLQKVFTKEKRAHKVLYTLNSVYEIHAVWFLPDV